MASALCSSPFLLGLLGDLSLLLGGLSLCLVIEGLPGFLSVVWWWRLGDRCLRLSYSDECPSCRGLHFGVWWFLGVLFLRCVVGDWFIFRGLRCLDVLLLW